MKEVKATIDLDHQAFVRQKKNFIFKKKIKRVEKHKIYSRIMLLINLRILKGPLFIYALLECIKIMKRILVIELEMGREVVIPNEFNIKQYASSFQFYDCLIDVIRVNFSVDYKKLVHMRYQHKVKH